MKSPIARPVTGDSQTIERALVAIKNAETFEQLRQGLALLLPLQCALSLEQTAQTIGVSQGWACQLRRRFIAGQVVGAPDAPTPGGRQNQNMSIVQERKFFEPFLEQAKSGASWLSEISK